MNTTVGSLLAFTLGAGGVGVGMTKITAVCAAVCVENRFEEGNDEDVAIEHAVVQSGAALYDWYWVTPYDPAVASGPGYLYKVDLPHGTDINSLYLVCVDNSATANLAATLYFAEFPGTPTSTTGIIQSADAIATVTSSGSNASVRSFATGTVVNGFVNNANKAYYVYVYSTTGSFTNMEFRGLRVECEL